MFTAQNQTIISSGASLPHKNNALSRFLKHNRVYSGCHHIRRVEIIFLNDERTKWFYVILATLSDASEWFCGSVLTMAKILRNDLMSKIGGGQQQQGCTNYVCNDITLSFLRENSFFFSYLNMKSAVQ